MTQPAIAHCLRKSGFIERDESYTPQEDTSFPAAIDDTADAAFTGAWTTVVTHLETTTTLPIMPVSTEEVLIEHDKNRRCYISIYIYIYIYISNMSDKNLLLKRWLKVESTIHLLMGDNRYFSLASTRLHYILSMKPNLIYMIILLCQ